MPSTTESGVRLQKVLADAGFGSRRSCEGLIVSGRVKVNGQLVTVLGTRVDPSHDAIAVDDRVIAGAEEKWYVALHKPAGYVSTARDTHGRPTVLDLLSGVTARLYPVGRLDLDSEGLMLLTNDGAMTNALLHPRYHVPKRYRVWVEGSVAPAETSRLREGVVLDDGLTAPALVKILESYRDRTTLEITLFEGRKRQIRRMCEAVGHPVSRLLRTAIGPLELGSLAPGEYRRLTQDEIRALLAAAGASGSPGE